MKFTFDVVPKKDNSQELTKIKEAQEKADPTKFSPLDSSIKLSPEAKNFGKGKPIQEQHTKDVFFKTAEAPLKERSNIFSEPEASHFVTLLSKGILHVSDIVNIEGAHYSKEMPIYRIESGEELELEAEAFILKELFGDWDRSRIYNNVAWRPETNQFAHYDYNASFTRNDSVTERVDFPFTEEKNDSSFPIPEMPFSSSKARENLGQFQSVVRKKLDLFKNQLSDQNFFDAVIKKSDIDLNSQRFIQLKGETVEEKKESLRSYLLNKITVLRNKVN